MANGMRQICLTLIPSAAFMAVLAEPITRLIYQRGQFNAHATDLVSEAMVVWAFSLPAQGVSLLLSRTFFSLQRPWLTTALSGGNLLINAVVALALYSPFGVTGVVLGTVGGTVGMACAQAFVLRGQLQGRAPLHESWTVSVSADLQSIMPAPVDSRSSLTIWALIFAIEPDPSSVPAAHRAVIGARDDQLAIRGPRDLDAWA